MPKKAHFTLVSRNLTIAAPNGAGNGHRDGALPIPNP